MNDATHKNGCGLWFRVCKLLPPFFRKGCCFCIFPSASHFMDRNQQSSQHGCSIVHMEVPSKDGVNANKNTQGRNKVVDTMITPWKINMEPKSHPIGKENHLNQTSICFIGKMVVPLGWYPSCLTCPRSPLKGIYPTNTNTHYVRCTCIWGSMLIFQGVW